MSAYPYRPQRDHALFARGRLKTTSSSWSPAPCCWRSYRPRPAHVTVNTDLFTGACDRFRSMPIWRPAPIIGVRIGYTGRYLLASVLLIALGLAIGFRPRGGASGYARFGHNEGLTHAPADRWSGRRAVICGLQSRQAASSSRQSTGGPPAPFPSAPAQPARPSAAARKRTRKLPHPRTLRRRHRPRDQMDHRRPLRRHADQRPKT